MTITTIVSLYLLSVLGVEGDENFMVFAIGAIGALSMIFAALVNMTMLIRIRNQHILRSELETNRSSRGISTTELEEGMFMGAFV